MGSPAPARVEASDNLKARHRRLRLSAGVLLALLGLSLSPMLFGRAPAPNLSQLPPLSAAAAAPAPLSAAAAAPAPLVAVAASPCGGIPVVTQVCAGADGLFNVPGDIVTSILTAINSWAAESADWVLHQVASVISTWSKPNLDAAWFRQHWAFMSVLAAAVMLPLVFAAVAKGALSGDPSLGIRAGCVYVPIAIIGTFMAINVVQLLINITDDLCGLVSNGFATDFNSFADNIGKALGAGSTGSQLVAPFVYFLASIITILVGLILFIELLVREAAIYATAIFIPLAFATIVFPGAAPVAKKLLSTLVAFILSKFFMVAVLSLGMSAMTADGHDGGLAAIIAGITVLAVTISIPTLLLSLIPLIEVAAISTVGMRAAVTNLAPPSSQSIYGSIRRDHEARLGGGAGGYPPAAGMGASLSPGPRGPSGGSGPVSSGRGRSVGGNIQSPITSGILGAQAPAGARPSLWGGSGRPILSAGAQPSSFFRRFQRPREVNLGGGVSGPRDGLRVPTFTRGGES